MNNPYSAPAADLSQPGAVEATYEPRFFTAKGRLGRARYFAYSMGVAALVLWAGMPILYIILSLAKGAGALATFLPMLLTLVIMGLTAVVAKRRLNDMNRSAWLLLLMLVPLANLGLGLWLLFGPGGKGSNKYGPAPCENSTGVVVACVAGVAALLLTIVATFGAAKIADAGISGNRPASVAP